LLAFKDYAVASMECCHMQTVHVDVVIYRWTELHNLYGCASKTTTQTLANNAWVSIGRNKNSWTLKDHYRAPRVWRRQWGV